MEEKLNTETQQQLRYAAIKLREKELTYDAIANILNISVAFSCIIPVKNIDLVG